MGIIVHVYRNSLGDSTNGGISSNHDILTVVNVDGPFKPYEGAPAVYLEEHVKGYLRLIPGKLEKFEDWAALKAGGNYATTSDSRFSEACEALLGHPFYGAVAIHDRLE